MLSVSLRAEAERRARAGCGAVSAQNGDLPRVRAEEVKAQIKAPRPLNRGNSNPGPMEYGTSCSAGGETAGPGFNGSPDTSRRMRMVTGSSGIDEQKPRSGTTR